MESLVDDRVVTCVEIVDTPYTTSINPNEKTSYWFIVVVLLAIACLLLLVVLAVGYYMKRELAIPCL